MPVIDNQIPLPSCADPDSVGAFEGVGHEPISRLCWSSPISLPDNLVGLDIRAVAEQRADGKVVGEPRVYLADHGWTAADACLIASALVTAADKARRMAADTPEVIQ